MNNNICLSNTLSYHLCDDI